VNGIIIAQYSHRWADAWGSSSPYVKKVVLKKALGNEKVKSIATILDKEKTSVPK
jgi:hypothetical protein